MVNMVSTGRNFIKMCASGRKRSVFNRLDHTYVISESDLPDFTQLVSLPESSGDCREASPTPVVSVKDEHGQSQCLLSQCFRSNIFRGPNKSDDCRKSVDLVPFDNRKGILHNNHRRSRGHPVFR